LLSALFFALPARGVTMEWVEIGDPGNDCDVQSQGCFGSVFYTYLIGKYEVTNAQYVEFLNAVADTDTYALYNTNMGNTGGIYWGGSPGAGVRGATHTARSRAARTCR
jgi:formylglycine-generating enzyme required for sulfatase activity